VAPIYTGSRGASACSVNRDERRTCRVPPNFSSSTGCYGRLPDGEVLTVSAARGLANINASENAIGKRLAMGNTANRMQGGTRGQTTSARLVVEN